MEYRNQHNLGITSSSSFDVDPRIQSSFDKELMRMAMLKHEEIFREQVYELHRLYRIQKLLMKDGTSNANARSMSRHQITSSRSVLKNQTAAGIKWMRRGNDVLMGSEQAHMCNQKRRDDEESNVGGVEGTGEIDESEIQLTLGPSIYSNNGTTTTTTPIKRVSNQRSSHTSRQSLSSSNSTTGSGSGSGSGSIQIHDQMMTRETDLTWGDFIRPSSTIMMENNHHHHHHNNNAKQMQMMMNVNPIGIGVGDEQLGLDRPNQQQQHPPWLFQALSLKLT